MAQHDVSFTIPERSLGKADLEFKIKRDREMVGRLKVSNGTMVWVPKNAQYGYRINWVRFDELMREHGKHEKA
ncbi:hypothetical protein [Povalibacter sp.]|uniref:hypothetical protein n=1 Tax=Povalibacter sp. TaxID=1962978 RepID=UPI002D1F9C26|nr:hypothetical protein [Povalibacter sp.]